jgi:hypothetical protein
MMKTLFKIFPVIPMIFFGACTNSDMAGGTTETENAIAKEEAAFVSIQVYSGKNPAKASYRVLPSWYVTDSTGNVNADDFTYVGETDSSGKIYIDNHKDGSYTIQIEQGDSALVYQYTINSLKKKFSVSKATLQKKGAINGWLSLPEDAKYAWVNIEGIGRVVKTDSLGFFSAKGLPIGQISVKSWDNDNTECIGEASFETQSGETLHIGHVLAPSKIGIVRSISFKPTDLVSDWMRPLQAPFVLTLRLDSTNFDFSKARKDGSDLQLFASNGAPVPMVIDSWETDIKSASINIRLEKLSDTLNTWTLEYGDPDATAPEKVNVWKGISDSLWYELNTVEIFNFESGSSRSDLPSPLKSDSWYAQLHKMDTLTDSVTMSYISTASIVEANNWLGKVMHIDYKVEYPDIVVFGTCLTRHPHDWSRMDSLVVWMKTDGDFEVILESLDDDVNYKASYKGKGKGLSDWNRLMIKPEDFTYKIRDYHGWEFVRNKITTFTIFTYNSTELWIDNVRAYGVNRDDLK